MWLKKIGTFFLILSFSISTFSQPVIKPNYGLKSHETLEILKIETTAEKTTVFLLVENRIEKGSFCADKDIYLIDQSGKRMKLLNATGIPVCPDSYRFKSVGEKLNFTLTFPPLKAGVLCADLLEECSDNCFSFYGIVLDENLNKELDDAFIMAESGQSFKALEKFTGLAEANQNKNGITALLYFNIIKLASETGNTVKAGDGYKKLISLSSRGGKIYIDQLNQQGIHY
jgi:hypothetical protein